MQVLVDRTPYFIVELAPCQLVGRQCDADRNIEDASRVLVENVFLVLDCFPEVQDAIENRF